MDRHRYVLDLAERSAAPDLVGHDVRQPTRADAADLASLMLDAYRNTIDFDDETLDDARQEVAGYLEEQPMLDASWIAVHDGAVIGASLVCDGEPPLIGYVMTAAARKNSGVATKLLHRTLEALATLGHTQVEAWITEGNVPSEMLFLRSGFTRD